MERDEILSRGVHWIIPVSSQIQKELIEEYPDSVIKHFHLGWPGVDNSVDCGIKDKFDLGAPRCVFVGKEWKRKGLYRAISIIDEFRSTVPNATLDVYGVEPSVIPKWMSEKDSVRIMGWHAEIYWKNYDILIHPAEFEPFGMVVAEARAFGVAVLMSDRVGAADLEFEGTCIVPLKAPLSEWVSKLDELLKQPYRSAEVRWTWEDLVDLHCQTIYPQVWANIAKC